MQGYMRFSRVFLGLILLIWTSLATAGPISVNLYVDSAPNKYGSPAYPGWESAAFSAASNGTFVNMANSADPANVGTTNFDIRDVVVYSFGDLGRRLTWVYWIPGETVSSLTGRFDISLLFDWGGVTYDAYSYYGYGGTWLAPTDWQDYAGGVIGTVGWAWGGAYGVNTPAALNADLTNWNQYVGDITVRTRLDGTVYSLAAQHTVPEAPTFTLIGIGLLGLAWGHRRRNTVAPA
jgi:hypothetical protein